MEHLGNQAEYIFIEDNGNFRFCIWIGFMTNAQGFKSVGLTKQEVEREAVEYYFDDETLHITLTPEKVKEHNIDVSEAEEV